MLPRHGSRRLALTVGVLLLAEALAMVRADGPRCDASNRDEVGIINSVRWHTEVMLGVLHAMSRYAPCATAYVHPVHHPDTSSTLKGVGGWGSHGAADLFSQLPIRLLPLPPLVGALRGKAQWIVPRAMPPPTVAPEATYASPVLDVVRQHRVLYFVSPEYEMKYVRAFVATAQPHTVVLMWHEPRPHPLHRMALLKRPVVVKVAVMSPHVARFMNASLVRAQVIVPTLPYTPADPRVNCFSEAGAGLGPQSAPALSAGQGQTGERQLHLRDGGRPRDGCLQGFAIQGRISVIRRSYNELYDEMLQCVQQQQDGPRLARAQLLAGSAVGLHATINSGTTLRADDGASPSNLMSVKLVGSVDAGSSGRAALRIPPALRSRVSVHSNLPYDRFYGELYSSYALLPRLASPSYLTEKITSSLISSLATGVPLLVDEGFLRSYSMLDNSTAFVMQPGETLCAAYNRIRGMAAEDYWAQRSRLLALAARLNEEAAQWFGEVLQKAQEGANYSSASKGQQ